MTKHESFASVIIILYTNLFWYKNTYQSFWPNNAHRIITLYMHLQFERTHWGAALACHALHSLGHSFGCVPISMNKSDCGGHHVNEAYVDAQIAMLFSCDQAALRTLISVCLSVCHTFLTMLLSSYHPEIFRSYHHWQTRNPCKRSRSEVKGQGHKGHDPI